MDFNLPDLKEEDNWEEDSLNFNRIKKLVHFWYFKSNQREPVMKEKYS
jgi:hypothetical protein